MRILRYWISLGITLIASVALGWPDNPTTCTILSRVDDSAYGLQAVSDGTNGKIFVWRCNSGIYVQRVSASGDVLWGEDGVRLGSGLGRPGNIYSPHRPIYAVSDESGGIFITWTNEQGILAQRVDGHGSILWDDELVTSSTEIVELPAMASDGAGGFIVTWSEIRAGINSVYAQRVDGSGVKQWETSGVLVCSNVGSYGGRPKVVSDGQNGAIISWEDKLSDIYCQRLDGTGNALWADNGLAIATGDHLQFNHDSCTDEGGGAYIMWEEQWNTNGYQLELRLQHVNKEGKLLLSAEENRFAAPNDHSYGKITSDGFGGALMTWVRWQFRYIYAQRMSAEGVFVWADGGTSVSLNGYYKRYPEVAADGTGGGFFTWTDSRGNGYDIYAQLISAAGEALWAENGVPVCTLESHNYVPVIVSDERGGAMIAWHGVDTTAGIGAAQISNEGVLGGESGVVDWAVFE